MRNDILFQIFFTRNLAVGYEDGHDDEGEILRVVVLQHP